MEILQLLILLFSIGLSHQHFRNFINQQRRCTPFSTIEPSFKDLCKVSEALQSLPDLPELIRGDYRNYTFPKLAIVKDTVRFAAGALNIESYLSIGTIVRKHGYGFEEHTVITEDGYILTLHRIPGKGKPVIVWHGTQGSSADSVTRKGQSLGYILSDGGYDVWLANNRGNQYSNRHKTLSPNCAEFWDFSWDEIGVYDVPAVIDYVLQRTGEKKVHYVGYSGGCTSFFIMGALRPEYNAKIYSMAGLSPAVYLRDSPSPPFRVMAFNKTVENIMLNALGKRAIFNDFKLDNTLAFNLCGRNIVGITLCQRFIYPLVGFKTETLDFLDAFSFAQHFQSRVSDRQIRYYNQRVRYGDFRRYDFGSPEKNIARYGTAIPPGYDLSAMRERITLYRGDNDWISQRGDVRRLVQQLPRGNVFVVSFNDNTHVDWILGSSKEAYYKIVRDFDLFDYEHDDVNLFYESPAQKGNPNFYKSGADYPASELLPYYK